MIPMKTKDFFEPLTLEEIKTKVNSLKRGFHEVEFITGEPIIVEGGRLIVTTRMSYRFRLNYGKNNIIRFEKAVYKVSTAEEVETLSKIYDLLSSAQRECISKRALEEYEAKKKAVADGTPLTISKRGTIERKRDTECPNIVYAENGSILLTCYKSFQYNVSKKEYRHPETHAYLVRDSGSVTELLPSDTKLKELLEKVESKARTLAGKTKVTKPSLVYTLKVGKILTIGGK